MVNTPKLRIMKCNLHVSERIRNWIPQAEVEEWLEATESWCESSCLEDIVRDVARSMVSTSYQVELWVDIPRGRGHRGVVLEGRAGDEMVRVMGGTEPLSYVRGVGARMGMV